MEDIIILDEEFGLGTILDINVNETQIMFSHGIETMDSDDIFVEEVEDINELSKETLLAYRQKSQKDPAFRSKGRGRVDKKTLAIRAKRKAGFETAGKKVSKKFNDEYDKRQHERTLAMMETKDHIRKHIPNILAHHGYSKVNSGEDMDTYIKPHKSGHILIAKIKTKDHLGDQEYGRESILKMRDSSGWSGSNEHRIDKNDNHEHYKMGVHKEHAIGEVHRHIAAAEKDLTRNYEHPSEFKSRYDESFVEERELIETFGVSLDEIKTFFNEQA